MKTAAVFLLGLDPTNTTSTHLQDRALSSLTSSLSAPSGATSELWWRAQQAVPMPSVYLHPTKPGTVCPAGMGLSDGCVPPSNLQLFQAAQSHMLTRFHDFLLPSPPPLFFFFLLWNSPQFETAQSNVLEMKKQTLLQISAGRKAAGTHARPEEGSVHSIVTQTVAAAKSLSLSDHEEQLPRKAVVSSSHQLMQTWVL